MKIGQVCEMFDITADTLRYYEKIGILYDIKRNNGIREYSDADLMMIDFIKNMRSAGLSINFLIQYVELFRQGDETMSERKQLLLDQKDLLEEQIRIMQKSLEKLKYKIRWYDDLIVKAEHEIAQEQQK